MWHNQIFILRNSKYRQGATPFGNHLTELGQDMLVLPEANRWASGMRRGFGHLWCVYGHFSTLFGVYCHFSMFFFRGLLSFFHVFSGVYCNFSMFFQGFIVIFPCFLGVIDMSRPWEVKFESCKIFKSCFVDIEKVRKFFFCLVFLIICFMVVFLVWVVFLFFGYFYSGVLNDGFLRVILKAFFVKSRACIQTVGHNHVVSSWYNDIMIRQPTNIASKRAWLT